MRFDIILAMAHRPGPGGHDQQAVYRDAVESAQWAERCGYDGAWVLEHHFTRYSLCASSLTMASFLLGHTTKLRVGSAITIVPLEHPIKLAERVAMLDHLSAGRFDFGIGRGTYARDYEAFGVDMATNHRTLVESTEAMLRAWNDEPIRMARPDGEVESYPVNPKPFTRPRPPMYLASTSEGSVAWAATRGFPLLIREAADDSTKRTLIRTYAEAAERAGAVVRNVPHALTCIAVLGDSDAAAIEMASTHVRWWVAEGASTNGLLARRHLLPNYRTYFEAVDAGLKAGAKDPKAVVDKMMALNLVGTPARCRERLAELCETTGIRHFVLGFDANAPGEPTRIAMERFMTEVIRPVAKQFGTVESPR